MVAPDLAFARRQLETLMVDACRVAWDPEGSADDAFDYDTGTLVLPSGDAATAYDETSVGTDGRSLAHPSGLGGVCLVSSIQATRSVALQLAGGARLGTVPYEVSLPLDASEVGPGAVVLVTASRDPGLVDRALVVRSVTYGTLQVARVLVCEERERGPD